MWNSLSIITALVSLLPFCIGIYKYNRIQRNQKPFIYLMGIYAICEIAGVMFIYLRESISLTVFMNVFVLVDFIFIYLLLSFWLNSNLSKLNLFIVALLTIIWLIDNIYLNSLTKTNSIFRIVYSFVISIESIKLINRQALSTNKNLFTNSFFIIGSTFLIFYIFKLIYEWLYFVNIELNNKIAYLSFGVLIIVNIVSYILYTIALICMKKMTNISSVY